MSLYQTKIKILLIALFALVLSNNPLQAQMNYSVRLGVNGCIEKQPSSLLPKYQITSGITARLPIGKHSRISLSLNYARKAFQYTTRINHYLSDNSRYYSDISKTSIEAPLLYEYQFNKGCYIGIGAFADGTLTSTYEVYFIYRSSNIEADKPFEERNKFNRKFDFGPCLNVGMIAKNGVGIQLLYTSGWQRFKTSSDYDYNKDLYFKNLALTVSYTFSHLKKSQQDEN